MEKKSFIWLLCVLAPMVMIGFIGFQQTNKLYIHSTAKLHQKEVHESLEGVLSLAKDVETGARGYVITGKEDYLDPYVKASGQMDDRLRQLKILIKQDDPDQLRQSQDLQTLINEKLEHMENTVLLRKEKGFAAASEKVAKGDGKRVMDNIRRLVESMEARNDDDSRAFTNVASKASSENMLRMTCILSIFALILAGCNIFYSRLN